jgi:hypothetical protein
MHETLGDVSSDYTPTLTSGQTIPGDIVNALASETYTYSVTVAAGADEGVITLEADLDWEDQDLDPSGTDNDVNTPGQVMIRTFSALTIDSWDANPTIVFVDETSTVTMQFTNNMATSVRLTGYSMSIAGRTQGVDYVIMGTNGPDVSGAGYLMGPGASSTIEYTVKVLATFSASVTTGFLVGYEDATSIDVSNSDGGTTIGGSGNPPVIQTGTLLVTPDNNLDPDTQGTTATISIQITNNPTAASCTIVGQTTITLYDDGTHGDITSGNGVWTGQWTAVAEGGPYNLDFDASNGGGSDDENGVGTLTIDDVSGPTISGTTANNGDPEVGTPINIQTTISDWSGVSSAQYSINGGAWTAMTGPGGNGNGVWTATWNSAG